MGAGQTEHLLVLKHRMGTRARPRYILSPTSLPSSLSTTYSSYVNADAFRKHEDSDALPPFVDRRLRLGLREKSSYQRCCCHAFLVWVFDDVSRSRVYLISSPVEY